MKIFKRNKKVDLQYDNTQRDVCDISIVYLDNYKEIEEELEKKQQIMHQFNLFRGSIFHMILNLHHNFLSTKELVFVA